MRGSVSRATTNRIPPAGAATLGSAADRDPARSARSCQLPAAGRGSIEISPLDAWQPVPHNPTAATGLSFKHWSRVLGMAGTLLVHGIGLDSLGWGSFAHITRAPEAQGIGSVRVDAHAAASEELVLLNLDSTEKADVSHGFLEAALRRALTKPVIDVQVPEPVPTADDSDVDGSSNYADAGDAQARALMAGRYRAQVSARVERAWVRPRTPVDESKAAPHLARVETPFICQVQIRQDARGNVQEVML